MIKIIFKKGQGLGNQLWLFAVAKSLSEHLNKELEIDNFENFKGKNFLKLDYFNFETKNQKDLQRNNCEKYSIFNEKIYYDSDLKYIISNFDENILKISDYTILEGIFQSEKYFFGNFNKLKRYISLKKSYINNDKIDSKFCVLNIRGGEYKRHKDFLLPKSYWENAIENFIKIYDIHKFKIVTDDYKYSKALFPDLEIIHSDISKCYSTIYNCKNIIVSNSSFAYFPCKTGIKKNIIAPMFWARPIKNNGRWISPCNLYKDWLYQDTNNELFKYKDCLKIAEKTDEYYKNEFTVLIRKKDIPSKGILNFLPIKFKIFLKKYLSVIFPKHIG